MKHARLESIDVVRGVIYLAWALVVAAMYPLCRWFAGLKQRRTDAWLSYT